MEVIPVKPAISAFEEGLGIESDDFARSETMVDYGYESSDALRNL